MEFICRFHDADELQRVRGLLRSKGIPTFAPQVESRRMGEQWALFVYLNEQADDARRILRDPGHEPAHPVDAVEFEAALPKTPDEGLFAKQLTILGAVVVVAFVALVCLLGIGG